MTDAVDIRCPKCGRWLAKVSEYGLAVCPKCGWEVEVRAKGTPNHYGRSQPLEKSGPVR